MTSAPEAYIKRESRGLLLVIVLAVLFLTVPYTGTIEGFFSPATARADLNRIEPVADGRSSSLYGTSAQLRPSCSFRRIDWFIGTRWGNSVPVNVNAGPTQMREEGPFWFGPWMVDATPDIVRDFSFANIYHQCRVLGVEAPWLTRTAFWN